MNRKRVYVSRQAIQSAKHESKNSKINSLSESSSKVIHHVVVPSCDSKLNVYDKFGAPPRTSPVLNDYNNYNDGYLNKNLLDYVLINNRSIVSKLNSKLSKNDTKYYSLNLTSYPMKSMNKFRSISTRKNTPPGLSKRRAITADNLRIK